MSRIIECRVNDEYILGSGVPIGAAGSHDDVTLRLTFNEMWDGLNIVATFKDALAESETVIQLMPSMLDEGDARTYLIGIPGGAKKYAGRVKLTLSGYSVYVVEENGTRIYKKDSLTNTATAFFRVLESDAAIVKDDADTETTYKDIVLDEINAFNVRMTELEGEMGDFKDEVEGTLDGYEKQEKTRDDAEERRDAAEEQRQINEFGAVGNHWNDDETAIVDADGNVVELEMAGRVGAEFIREQAEIERDGREKARIREEQTRIKDEITRQDKEAQRHVAEFGAVGNHWNDDETAIVDADGNVVELEMAGRVGAELLRQKEEDVRISNEKDRQAKYEAAFGGLEEGKSYKNYIDAKIDGLIGSAPGELDTLKEIADYIGEGKPAVTILADIAKNTTRIGELEDDTVKKGSGENTIQTEGSAALSENSTAIGDKTTALGNAAFASGVSTSLAPDPENITTGNIDEVWGENETETNFVLASGDGAHVEGLDNVAIGKGSHAEGFDTKALNSCTHTEGFGTRATGDGSHAEGGETTATQACSHAEGHFTLSSGFASHAEGRLTQALGDCSHAEGFESIASGEFSHAEAHANAIGKGAHAEGYLTEAKGAFSHTEGIGTTSTGAYQHVEGRYNEPDTLLDDGPYGHYVHIVGGGLGENKRQNIHTVDWHGNAWFRGNIKVGGDSYDEGSVLVTKSEADAYALTVSISEAESAKSYTNSKFYELNIQNGMGSNSLIMREAHAAAPKSAAFGASSNFGSYAFTEGYQTTNIGKHGHAEGSSTTFFNDTLRSYNISHLTNYTLGDLQVISVDETDTKDKATTISEVWRKAKFLLSNGDGAHAEGYNTLSIGFGAHAEGYETKAIQRYAHAEGAVTTASGGASHAEGYLTVASAAQAHAEGTGTTASGSSAHAQGYMTVASGENSFSAGQGTKATAKNQTVIGQYNDEDADALFIVGNGTSAADRSNAFVVKKDGTVFFSQLGDISTALDSIIAIQESLIGGAANE